MEQLFGSIPSVLKTLESNPTADEAVVFAAWRRCAGEMLSKKTRPLEFRSHRLIIAVADKAWQRQMEGFASQMLVKLNDSLGQGTVKFIEFRIGL
jgi:predicted nucleic acid-binding Zn ribbon protein